MTAVRWWLKVGINETPRMIYLSAWEAMLIEFGEAMRKMATAMWDAMMPTVQEATRAMQAMAQAWQQVEVDRKAREHALNVQRQRALR